MPAPAKPSRTQKERRDETRSGLLDATIESLVEVGFRKTTTLEVQRRAGVSRGALLHHFPSKTGLIAAAVRHLAELRGRQIKQLSSELPQGSARIGAVLDLLWESFTGSLFCVAMELRAAARTDDELRAVLLEVERDVRDRIVNQSRHLLGPEIADRPGFELAIDMSLQFMIGAAMTSMLHGESVQALELLDHWKQQFPLLLDVSRGTQKVKHEQRAEV
jgi:AcrR family transcriptional regulator